MTRNVTLYLSDILNNMTQIRSFIGSMTYDEFVADRKTSYAVVRCLEIVGEATRNIPEKDKGIMSRSSLENSSWNT